MMKLQRITYNALRGIVAEAVHRVVSEMDGMSYRQMRNVLGDYDDDDLNAAVEAEEHEDLEGQIRAAISELGTQMEFDDLCELLEERFGFEYVGPDENREAHAFSNGESRLNVFPRTYYDRQGTIRVRNLYVS